LRLSLNRPERRNALDTTLVHALLQALEPADYGAVVVGSMRPSMFCSGADTSLDDAQRAAVSDLLYGLCERMLSTPAPIIVAVGGHAVGGGAQLAVAGDLRIASPDARFRFLGPAHGLSVAAWGLPSLVGRGRALDLCLTMREVDADEALGIGLVEYVESDPDAVALELAKSFAGLAPEAVARVKRVVAEATGVQPALQLERRENRGWSGTIAGSGKYDRG
jgi:enoyl-CoA hydratase/carnithine racemase